MSAPLIMIVDSEPGVLNALRRLLRFNHRDWEVHCFESADQALTYLPVLRPWVVFVDRYLPRLDGVAFLERVASLSPQALRVLLSGDTRLESALKATSVAHLVVRKPFDHSVIDELLDRAQILHQLPLSESLRNRLGAAYGLPVLPEIYGQISEELAREEPDITAVSALIKTDQILLSRILHLVNSPFFGFQSRTLDVDVAVMRLGLKTIHNLVLIIELYQNSASVSPVLGNRLMHEALALAEQAAELCDARRVSKNLRNQVLVAALLHNIGQLVITDELDAYPLIGAYLLELWGFEQGLIEAIQHQLDDELPQQRDAATELLNTTIKRQKELVGNE